MATRLTLVIPTSKGFGASTGAREMAARLLVEDAATTEPLLVVGAAVAVLLDRNVTGGTIGRVADRGAAMNGAIERFVANRSAGARYGAFIAAERVGRGSAVACLRLSEGHAGRAQAGVAQQHAFVRARLCLVGVHVS